jgi:hypothetical protein
MRKENLLTGWVVFSGNSIVALFCNIVDPDFVLMVGFITEVTSYSSPLMRVLL